MPQLNSQRKRERDAMGQRLCKRGQKTPLKKETTEMKVFIQFAFDGTQSFISNGLLD